MPNDPHPAATSWQRRWTAVVDWLGAQKPLDLILGAVTLISACSVIAHLL